MGMGLPNSMKGDVFNLKSHSPRVTWYRGLWNLGIFWAPPCSLRAFSHFHGAQKTPRQQLSSRYLNSPKPLRTLEDLPQSTVCQGVERWPSCMTLGRQSRERYRIGPENTCILHIVSASWSQKYRGHREGAFNYLQVSQLSSIAFPISSPFHWKSLGLIPFPGKHLNQASSVPNSWSRQTAAVVSLALSGLDDAAKLGFGSISQLNISL